jgi:hypothetical protein
MQTWFPERVGIVAEGDSWFAYPPKWLVGKPPNLVSHIARWTKGKANFYSMASNGDEAVDMVSGKEKHKLVNVLRWHKKARNRKPVDLLLFSGGGNDVVGENDYERFIRPYKAGYTARECLRVGRLERKIKQIGLAYHELVDIRDHYSPSTIIITHTYDYPYASLVGMNFLGGLIKNSGWMKRYMDDVEIPEKLQTKVIREFMNLISDRGKNTHENEILVSATIGARLGARPRRVFHISPRGLDYVGNPVRVFCVYQLCIVLHCHANWATVAPVTH